MNTSTYNRLKSLSQSVALGARGKITAAFLALAAIVALFPRAAVATPGEGIISATVFATASFADPTDIRFRIRTRIHEIIRVNDAGKTVVQQVIIAPAGHTGWHTHPGPVVVLIKAGTMSFYDGEDPSCTVRTYAAGESFVDSGQGHVHIARNEGSENLELWATYFDVPDDGIFRIDAAAPGNCPF